MECVGFDYEAKIKEAEKYAYDYILFGYAYPECVQEQLRKEARSLAEAAVYLANKIEAD